MAYVSKEQKAKVVGLLKAAFPGTAKERGFKYSVAVRNSSTLVLTISEGSIDFIGNYLNMCKVKPGFIENHDPVTSIQVNEYHLDSWFSGQALEILTEIKRIMNTDNYDNSDAMTDYFDRGHFVSINIGRWDKPYRLLA
jgi:hypothetical protein